MNVINAPNITKPVMLYDGDCGFCARWVEKWQRLTGNRVIYEPYQKALKDFPTLTAVQCRQAVQLIDADHVIYSGAHAVFRALALAGKYRVLLWMYMHIPLYKILSETIYQWIAHRRGFFSKFSRTPQCRI